MRAELAPARKVAEEAPQNVDIEKECERNLAEGERADMFARGVSRACRLEDDGSQGEQHPDPLRAVVPLLDRRFTCYGSSI